MKVELTWFELHLAAMVGVRRHLEALRGRLPDRFGASEDDGWSLHVEGAAGELAAAKALNRYYAGSINTFHNGSDVGSTVQVRTRSRSDYDLIVRDNDCDEDVFVLVLGRSPTFEVAGWIRGEKAKRSEWRQTYGGRPPAYFVPQAALTPLMR